ncbi:DUF2809 domain-containing protein [Salegentibacter sp. F188]|uniref:DUF2809 domain-containing protein n=1 Tax=Autumnicola patrickiae TaxID=3075591 RepID=A0ABU3E318_9FLAO|nr:DUF2809 domain-containing protein [Salegentibacter sp. F188]MDT0690395.1 DUF2809 domain-containing protein [Salegentibacter sp. F188]
MFIFNRKYFLAAIVLFVVEVFIAIYVRDKFIRPYAGDFLVVMLLYFFLKSFLKISVTTAAISVLAFAYFIEALQYLHIIDLLGIQNNKFAAIVLGSHFEWEDMLAYTLGILTVFGIEKIKERSEL